MKPNNTCPIDGVKVDSNIVRTTANLVLMTSLMAIVFKQPMVNTFLLIDFSLRAAGKAKYSPLFRLASCICRACKAEPDYTDAAPKRFAALAGTSLVALILLMMLLSWWDLALVLTLVLHFFAILESWFGFCVGCKVYELLKKFRG